MWDSSLGGRSVFSDYMADVVEKRLYSHCLADNRNKKRFWVSKDGTSMGDHKGTMLQAEEIIVAGSDGVFDKSQRCRRLRDREIDLAMDKVGTIRKEDCG